MAWVRVRQGWLPPMPQQPFSSLPASESTVRVPPVANGAQQAVERVRSQKSPVPQLVASLQLVRQAPAPQMKGEQSVVPGVGQLPAPSQTLALLWVDPLQLCSIEPQLTPGAAKTQAPTALQSVAAQAAAVLVQAAVQQWPLPEKPQTPEVQASFSVQAPVAVCGVHVPALQ